MTWKGHLTCDNDSGSYEINLLYYKRVGTPEEWLFRNDKLLKALDGQSICTGPLRYTFTERLLTGDTKATINQVALDIGIRTIDNFNKVLAVMTKKNISSICFPQMEEVLM